MVLLHLETYELIKWNLVRKRGFQWNLASLSQAGPKGGRKNIPRGISLRPLIELRAMAGWFPLVLYLIALKITLFSSCDLHFKDDTIASSIANATSPITAYRCGASSLPRSNHRSWLAPKIACTAGAGTAQVSSVTQLGKKTFIPVLSLRNFHSQVKIVFLWLRSWDIADNPIFLNAKVPITSNFLCNQRQSPM